MNNKEYSFPKYFKVQASFILMYKSKRNTFIEFQSNSDGVKIIKNINNN